MSKKKYKVEQIHARRSKPKKSIVGSFDDAIRRRDLEALVWMVDSNEINPNDETTAGETPLIAAIAANNPLVVELLVSRGANPNLVNRNGFTPLMKAATVMDASESVLALLRHHADIFATDRNGKTALEWARLSNNTQVARRLEMAIQQHIYAKRRDQAAHDMEHRYIHVRQRHEEISTRMKQAVVNYNSNEIQNLVRSAEVSVDEYRGAYPDDTAPLYYLNVETSQGWTALVRAAAMGDLTTVETLVNYGVDINYETKLRHTALTWAACCGHKEIIQYLLQKGVDFHRQTKEGKTALIHAARNGQIQVVSILLGAYHYRCIENSVKMDYIDTKIPEWHDNYLELIHTTDREGKHALQHARDEGHAAVVKALEEAQSNAENHAEHVDRLRAKTTVVACQFNCGYEHAKDLISYHEENKCPHRIVSCENCVESMQSMQLEEHKQRVCPGRIVSCVNLQYGCHVTLPYREMEIHELEHCHSRQVSCRLDCGKLLRWNLRDGHEAHDCPLRLVTCPQCHASMRGQELRGHLKHDCVKRIVSCKLYGGCGERHIFEETQFHIEYLCVLRPLPCRWTHHGCDAIVGPPEVRHAHEASTCQYRIVRCKNKCSVNEMLECFASEHYRWDCPKERMTCPLGCSMEMEAQYIEGHQEINCGFCPKRPTRCNYDLCGKKLLLFGDPTPNIQSRSNDVLMESNALSLHAVQQRINHMQSYINTKLQQTMPLRSQPFLKQWLTSRLNIMAESLAKMHLESTNCGLVIRYDAMKNVHLISIDGEFIWIDLNHTYYAEELHIDWVCGWLPAELRQEHQATTCAHKPIPCPLDCGQICQQYQLAAHMRERCFKRTLVCRLGCGISMPVEELLAHEESECALSHAFCHHCRLSLIKKDMEEHLARNCPNYPRKCHLTCGAVLSLSEFEVHERNDCPKRLVHCAACKKVLFADEREVHASEECPFRSVGACPLGCGENLLFNQVQLHVATECLHRKVSCPQCEAEITFDSFDYHRQYLCSERMIYCHKGCGTCVRESGLAHHEEENCVYRPCPCPLHCGMECAMATVQRHVRGECIRRLVSCPNRCTLRVPAIELPAHLKNCDHRMVLCGAGGEACIRPLKAWLTPTGLLERCYTHHEHGFMWAIKSFDIETILTFLHLMHPSGIDEEFSTGYTPLAFACSKGALEIVRILLLHGAHVNLETSRGRTALSEATLGQQGPIVELLVEQRAVVSHTNRHGLSIISIAQQMNQPLILSTLEKRLKLEEAQKELFIAIGSSDYSTIEQLIAGGEMIHRESHAWHLAKEYAASKETLEKTRMLLSEHMDAMNTSIADSEAKQLKVVKILDSVEHNKAQMEHVLKKEMKLEAVQQYTELTVKHAIQAITAQDIVSIISQTEPPPGLLVVLKAMALFNGVIPRLKRGTDQNGFSDKEWWETAQAMLMDRQFLRKLVNFRELDVPPDVLFKVRRECLKHDEFPDVPEFAAPMPATTSTIPHPKRKYAATPFMALSTWVRGVEVNQKSKAEAKILGEKKEAVQIELERLDSELKQATFHMKSAHRSLPSRQEELDRIIALEAKAAADFQLKQRRVEVCDLLAFTSLSGHTPVSFAASIGNERALRLMINRGANCSYSDEEQRLASRVLQQSLRQYTHQLKLTGQIATVSSIAGYMQLTPLLKALRRYRQCNRIALHEAVYNGHSDILQVLVDTGHARVWQTSYVEPIAAFPSQNEWQQEDIKPRGMSVWELHSLAAPINLQDALNLGAARYSCPAFRPKVAWDMTSTKYDDTKKELDHLIQASAKRQARKRDEQLSRKAILRKAANQHKLHEQLDSAIRTRDFVLATNFLDRGAFPEYATTDGLTILMQACTEEIYITNADGDCVLVVDFLLDRSMGRPSPNHESMSVSGEAFTALLVAAHYGTIRCARSLIVRGADINIRTTTTGTTPLMVAVQNNRDDFAMFLLEHRPNVHVKDRHGRTALSYAMSTNNEKLIGLISQAAADIQHKLQLHERMSEHGICSWGCGYMSIKEVPILENGGGHIAGFNYPLREHEQHACPKRIVACPLCGACDLWSEELPSHLETHCPERLLPCSNAKCGETIPFHRLLYHERQECIHRSVSCSLCGEVHLAHKLNMHENTQCRLRLIPCAACATLLPAMDHSRHLKFECVHREVPCRLGCGWVEYRLRDTHEATECSKRPIPCLFGCELATTPEDQAMHELSCTSRWVSCPNRCSDRIRAFQVADHLLECSYRFVSCVQGCSHKLRFVDMDNHITATCSRRLVTCEKCRAQMTAVELAEKHHDCGARIVSCGACGCGGILAQNLASHKEIDCRMRLVKCKYEYCMKTPLFAHEKHVHETLECRYRLTWCPLGCQAHLVAKDIKAHEGQCSMRFTKCSLGCGIELREKDREEHEQYDCLYHKK